MRPRAGTRPVTLEPPRIQEILSLARQHDDMLKEVKQDLFRAETKLRVEREWKWPIRLGCVGLGALVLAGCQNEVLMANAADLFRGFGERVAQAGNMAFVGFAVVAVVIWAAVFLVRRALSRPSPQKTARKLMEQFAQKDGVAAYVFTDETPDEMVAELGALTREEHKDFRKRKLTPSNRTLQSQMTTLLNRTVEETQPLLH